MDIMTFRTRKDALAEIEKMQGWTASPVRLYLPGYPNTNRQGNTWVIACRVGAGDRLYLMQNGSVS